VAGLAPRRFLLQALDLRVELFPYAPFATRIWDLRDNATCYDAWYVALAEALNGEQAGTPPDLISDAVTVAERRSKDTDEH
jgi:hypothetical protein